MEAPGTLLVKERAMSQRYQKEIEEILGRARNLPAGKKQPKEDSLQSEAIQVAATTSPPSRGWIIGKGRVSVSPGRLMVAGILLLVAALVLRAPAPGIVGPVVWVGISFFVLAYLLFFLKPRRPFEKRWRGRPIENRPQSNLLWRQFRRWIGSK